MEKEVLFPPGTQFKVLSSEINKMTGTREIFMIEVTKGDSK